MIQLFRSARQALNDGDLEPFLSLLADDVMWWDTGVDDPLMGREAVAERLRELAEFGIQDDLHDVFANDEHLVALIHAEAARDGRSFGYSTAEIYHLTEEGLIAKRQAFAHDSSKIAEFFNHGR